MAMNGLKHTGNGFQTFNYGKKRGFTVPNYLQDHYNEVVKITNY